jgi:hypothetical protein
MIIPQISSSALMTPNMGNCHENGSDKSGRRKRGLYGSS